jgi:hypothetical protein
LEDKRLEKTMTEPFDFQSKWEKLVCKAVSMGHESLSPDERVWLNVQYLTNSICNGGLISYYYNSPADTIEDCLKALEVIGADRIKTLMERMNTLFPGGVPKNITARNEVIDSWPEDDKDIERFLDKIEESASSEAEKVEAKLVKFIQKTGIGS